MKRYWQAFGLQSLLLVLVFATHYMPDLIATGYPGRELAAAKAWQLVLRGGQDAILYLIAWSLVPMRPWVMRVASSLACAWGFFESVQIPACRLAYPMDKPPSADTRLYSGLCDHVSGLPVYMLTLYVILIAAALNWTRRT